MDRTRAQLFNEIYPLKRPCVSCLSGKTCCVVLCCVVVEVFVFVSLTAVVFLRSVFPIHEGDRESGFSSTHVGEGRPWFITQ